MLLIKDPSQVFAFKSGFCLKKKKKCLLENLLFKSFKQNIKIYFKYMEGLQEQGILWWVEKDKYSAEQTTAYLLVASLV